MDDVDKIEDIEKLQKLLDDTEDFDNRRKIRNRLRELKKKRSDEREAQSRKHDQLREDRLKGKSIDAAKRKTEELTRMKSGESVGAKNIGVMQEQIARGLDDADKRKAEELKRFAETAKHDSVGLTKKTTVTTTTGKDGGKKTSTKTTVKSNDPKDVQKVADMMSQPGAKGSGKLTVTTTKTATKDGKTSTQTTTSTKPIGSPSSLSPTSPGGGKEAVGLVRNPSAVKEMLLAWAQAMTKGYEHVEITNFSSSWATGMAFCALIHHFFPKAFNYTRLNPKNRKGNFKLGFKVAEDLADVYPLLDPEDMVLMGNKPDWKCVFTYVQALYRGLHDKKPDV
ncbi:PREDICTED: smoothelin-like [Priapulus caudatus]|uniref:Smoothelin-like n=1 Tax=Priapulus caudatus TaxID=37621 RepID=A0ABM1DR57_PRICU|nr:PREDICTED: smoothelin-like [Priapulus caudatus]